MNSVKNKKHTIFTVPGQKRVPYLKYDMRNRQTNYDTYPKPKDDKRNRKLESPDSLQLEQCISLAKA